MKLKITAALTAICGLLLLLDGAVVTVHAKTPHQCIRPGTVHAMQHTCGHSDNTDYQHGLGEISPAQARGEQHGLEFGAIPSNKHDASKDEASMDFTDPCICPVRCFLRGALNNTPAESWSKIRKYGLFNDK